MDYVFRLADGRRLALWSEKNQVIRQLSGGGGNRSQLSLRTDFLSDLSAVSVEGRFYYVYQNTSRRVVLSLPDGEEDRILFGESIEHCRHGGLTLIENGGQLYLFYTAWSPIRERYSLNVCKPLEWITGEEAAVGGEVPAKALLKDEETAPTFQVISEAGGIRVIVGQRCFCLNRKENGEESWREGRWCDADKLNDYEEQRIKMIDLTARADTYREEIQQISETLEQKKLIHEQACRDHKSEMGRVTALNHELEEKIIRLDGQYQQLIQKNQETEKLAAETKTRLNVAITQYNELAEVARQLQIEGKKWRDKYYQETKKKRVRPPGAE